MRKNDDFLVEWNIKSFLCSWILETGALKSTWNIYLFCVIGNLDIFPLISSSYIVSINKITLILTIISQCEVKHDVTLPIKTITSILKVSTNIISSSYHSRYDTSDNVCLGLQNCFYSTYITQQKPAFFHEYSYK